MRQSPQKMRRLLDDAIVGEIKLVCKILPMGKFLLTFYCLMVYISRWGNFFIKKVFFVIKIYR